MFTFGKRDGLELFASEGFTGTQHFDLLLEDLQLRLDDIPLDEDNQVFSRVVLKTLHNGNFSKYLFFLAYTFAQDKIGRPGYIAVAVCYYNCIPQLADVDPLTDLIRLTLNNSYGYEAVDLAPLMNFINQKERLPYFLENARNKKEHIVPISNFEGNKVEVFFKACLMEDYLVQVQRVYAIAAKQVWQSIDRNRFTVIGSSFVDEYEKYLMSQATPPLPEGDPNSSVASIVEEPNDAVIPTEGDDIPALPRETSDAQQVIETATPSEKQGDGTPENDQLASSTSASRPSEQPLGEVESSEDESSAEERSQTEAGEPEPVQKAAPSTDTAAVQNVETASENRMTSSAFQAFEGQEYTLETDPRQTEIERFQQDASEHRSMRSANPTAGGVYDGQDAYEDSLQRNLAQSFRGIDQRWIIIPVLMLVLAALYLLTMQSDSPGRRLSGLRSEIKDLQDDPFHQEQDRTRFQANKRKKDQERKASSASARPKAYEPKRPSNSTPRDRSTPPRPVQEKRKKVASEESKYLGTAENFVNTVKGNGFRFRTGGIIYIRNILNKVQGESNKKQALLNELKELEDTFWACECGLKKAEWESDIKEVQPNEFPSNILNLIPWNYRSDGAKEVRIFVVREGHMVNLIEVSGVFAGEKLYIYIRR